jgi:hypothetical protein
MIPFHKFLHKIQKIGMESGTHPNVEGCPPFPRSLREGGDVDFLSAAPDSKTKKPCVDFRNH